MVEFRKVLDHTSATTLVALPEHNKFLVLVKEQGILLSYPLNVLALIYMEQLHSQALEAKREQVSGSDKVVFFQVGTVSSKVTGVYFFLHGSVLPTQLPFLQFFMRTFVDSATKQRSTCSNLGEPLRKGVLHHHLPFNTSRRFAFPGTRNEHMLTIRLQPFSVTGTVYGASFFNNVVAIAMDKSIVMVSPNTCVEYAVQSLLSH